MATLSLSYMKVHHGGVYIYMAQQVFQGDDVGTHL